MLPTAMPSLALISAYGTGGSSISRAISCWSRGGRCVNASRSAACRSAASSPCSIVSAWPSGMFSASGSRLAACGTCALFRTRWHSRRVVVASQPGSAAGSRILPSWVTSSSQTFWPTSAVSIASSRYRRQSDQISGAYRSTSAAHARSSPSLAPITTATTGLPRIGSASRAQSLATDMALPCLSAPNSSAVFYRQHRAPRQVQGRGHPTPFTQRRLPHAPERAEPERTVRRRRLRLWYGRGGGCSSYRGGWDARLPCCADQLHRPGRDGARGGRAAGGVPAGDDHRDGRVGK